MELKERECVSDSMHLHVLKTEEMERLRKRLISDWAITDKKQLKKAFPFEKYKRGMAFVQEVALIAEKENHHPDICIRHTTVEIMLTTHDVNGLSINDFIMAAKIEDL